VEGDVGNTDPEVCLGAIYLAIQEEITGIRCAVQHMTQVEQIPSDIKSLKECLAKLPEVFDWMQRSAFRRGATTALAMCLSHFDDTLAINETMEGFAEATPGEPLPAREVEALLAQAAPFAERILRAGDLTPYMATQRAPGDPEPEREDFAVSRPFQAACQGSITTHVVNAWQPKHTFFRDMVRDLTAEAENSGARGVGAATADDGAVDARGGNSTSDEVTP